MEADVSFTAICCELQVDGGVVRREGYDWSRSLSGTDRVVDGVVGGESVVHVAYEELITNDQVASVGNGS